ncbi:DUF6438 domain-containing protein [Methylovulum psychrotolerans]|uniref:DUF6438 domain-containing protein n=1 Tax=Methylovulum psychrotolerans TaxID=1704499 RepID=A0A2S5CLS7_9GAMM|nr:DUF6438 domain-containing protein [Methylovulum psychrotolerans]POZ51728.1 hypothetical protein AADEFJLK_02601 [Methylovulum psychrotolerans]
MVDSIFKKIGFLLFMVVIGSNSAAALSADLPIITLSVGLPPYPLPITEVPIADQCGFSYIIKIFENGRVDYQGFHKIKVPGKREYQMDKATLKALIKKFQDAHFMEADERVWLPDIVRSHYLTTYSAIRFRQGSQEATVFDNFPFPNLKSDIIRATKAGRWGVNEPSLCINKGVKYKN